MSSLPSRISDQQVDELLTKPDARTGKTPLEVLLKSMCWFDASADRVLGLLERMVVTDDPQSRREAQALMEEFLVLRARAQQSAVAAAPYCHGRLAATDHSPLPPQGHLQSVDWENISPVEAARAYQLIIRGK